MPRGRKRGGLSFEEFMIYFILGVIVLAFAIYIITQVVKFLLILAAGIILGIAAITVLYGIYRLVKYATEERRESRRNKEGL